jgi:hypothetical protein
MYSSPICEAWQITIILQNLDYNVHQASISWNLEQNPNNIQEMPIMIVNGCVA